jgi:hypothetical protein
MNTGYEYTNIKTQTTTNIFEGRGVLRRIIINTPLANGVIKIYNNIVGSGAEVGIITQPATLLSDIPPTLPYNSVLGIGCTIVTSGANQNITVVWSKS